ncbi:MAG TPA: BTAD domain-containing putative transcriptional regulator [Gammaproteobacteria bacterium]
MTSSVGTMKIAQPRLPTVLCRPRLFTQLEPSEVRAAVWIAGPPGAGKTALAGSYLAEHKRRHIWYQLGAEDADLATFFHYLALAAPRHRAPLPHLTPEYLAGVEIFARRYFESLYARLTAPFTIVFDNYHEVPDGAPLHAVLAAAISLAPPGIHFIVLSRQSPPPALARLRMHGTLHELDGALLAFTDEEALQLARQRKKAIEPDAAERLVQALQQRANGWAAGLVLLLERGLEKSAGAPVDPAAPPDVLFGYFASEIFERMDDATRAVLLKTAFLPRIDAQSAARVTGAASAIDLFQAFARRQYFTVRHADGSYQLHPLFRDFLLRRAACEFTEATLQEYRLAAAQALEQVAAEEAVVLYIEAAAWDDAARLIGALAQGLADQGRQQTLVCWIEALPRTVVASDAWLQFWLGMSVLWDPGRAQTHLESAFEQFRARQDATGAFLAWSGVVEAIMYAWGAFGVLDRWIAEMETLREQFPEFPSAPIEARVIFGMFCALHFRQPYHPDMSAWTQRAHALLLNAPDPTFRVMLGSPLAFHYTSRGDMEKARHIVEVLQPFADPRRISLLAFVAWAGLKSSYDWGIGTPRNAAAVLNEALALVERDGVLAFRHMLLANRVYAALSYGDSAVAAEALHELAAQGDPRQACGCEHMYYLKAWAAFVRGDAGQAYEDLQYSLRSGVDGGMYLGSALGQLAMAQVLVALARYEEANTHLEAARQAGTAIGSTLIEFHCRYIAVQMAHARGQSDALGHIEDALRYGRERNLMLILYWNATTAFPLLAAALREGIEVAYVQHIIRCHELQPPQPPLDIEHWPWPVRIYTLGRFAVVHDGEPVRFSGKTQKKPLELLKFLIASGGRDVATEKIADILWPDADGDAAAQALRVAVHRLRKLLGDERAMQVHDAGLSLDARFCWVDTWAFERLLPNARPAGALAAEQVDACVRGLALYKGPFLGGSPVASWAVPLAERLRLKFLRYTLALGETLEADSQHATAADCYQRGLDVDNMVEEFYHRAIVCYRHLQRSAEARATYERCRTLFMTVAGIEPSAELRRLIEDGAA